MRLLWLGILSLGVLGADYIDFQPAAKGPWFTGPLLTPSAFTIPVGHSNLQPYLYVDNTSGLFNKHWNKIKFPDTVSDICLQFYTQVGINSFMDFTITPTFFYNYVGDDSYWRFGDLYTEVGFQLCQQVDTKGFTAKFAFGELFPTGVYQFLKVGKFKTDSSGGGTFQTTFKMVFSRRWNPYSFHYLAARMSISGVLSPQVAVHGANAYGGDNGTRGTVFPGTSFPLFMGFEYNMTRNWVLALDIANTLTLKTKFKGHTTFPVGWGWAYSLSFAPAIEYNFNQNVGLIWGVWFTGPGRNSQSFINYILSLNWYI